MRSKQVLALTKLGFSGRIPRRILWLWTLRFVCRYKKEEQLGILSNPHGTGVPCNHIQTVDRGRAGQQADGHLARTLASFSGENRWVIKACLPH